MASAQVRPPAQPAALLPKLTVVWRPAPGDHDYNVALAKGDKAEAAQIKREAVVSKPVRMRQPPRLFARGCIDLTRCKQRAGKSDVCSFNLALCLNHPRPSKNSQPQIRIGS